MERVAMRTADDDDAQWSIEILDGDCVNLPTKPVKQTPSASTPSTGSKPLSNLIHPFFSNDFSTKAKVVVSGTQSAGQETTKRAFDAHRTPSLFPTQGSHTPSTTNRARKPRQPRPFAAVDAHCAQGQLQFQFQEQCNVAKSYGPTQLRRDTSSSSSQLNTSGNKASEEQSPLPVYSFAEYQSAPAVVYTKSESEANSLVQTLKGPLGFDLEWRVAWQRGAQERRTALVQLCDHRTILLIQVSSMKRFPKKVLDVIESADIVKTGANILNDGEKLFRDFGIWAKGLVELGALATKADDNFSSIYNREIVSLAKMVAMYLGRTLSKGKVRTSNWEADLSQKMTEYAANDCHCALMVYDRLQEIAAKASKTLDVATYSRQVSPRSLKPTILPQRPDSSMKPPIPHYCIPEPPRPQQLCAYKLWHVDKMPLDEMCMKLRTGARVEPLKESTVISYVVGALQADPRLPFNVEELKALVLMEASSWQRHRQWIASRE